MIKLITFSTLTYIISVRKSAVWTNLIHVHPQTPIYAHQLMYSQNKSLGNKKWRKLPYVFTIINIELILITITIISIRDCVFEVDK